MKYRAGQNGRITGKDTKTTRNVATSMRKMYKYNVKIQERGIKRFMRYRSIRQSRFYHLNVHVGF